MNLLCHEFDESFPDLYYDYNEIKSFCQSKPYYFFDMLDTKLVVKLFCEYFDDKINILTVVAKKLCTEGLRAAYEYVNGAMGLSEDIDELVRQTEECLKVFS